jgi:hypothetical protein
MMGRVLGKWIYYESNYDPPNCFSITEVARSDFASTDDDLFERPDQRQTNPSSIAKPVRPVEFSLLVAIPFVNLFLLLAIMLGILYGKAYAQGKWKTSSDIAIPHVAA